MWSVGIMWKFCIEYILLISWKIFLIRFQQELVFSKVKRILRTFFWVVTSGCSQMFFRFLKSLQKSLWSVGQNVIQVGFSVENPSEKCVLENGSSPGCGHHVLSPSASFACQLFFHNHWKQLHISNFFFSLFQMHQGVRALQIG